MGTNLTASDASSDRKRLSAKSLEELPEWHEPHAVASATSVQVEQPGGLELDLAATCDSDLDFPAVREPQQTNPLAN